MRGDCVAASTVSLAGPGPTIVLGTTVREQVVRSGRLYNVASLA